MKVLMVGIVLGWLAACSSPAVRCDTRLNPINAPAKVSRAPTSDAAQIARKTP